MLLVYVPLNISGLVELVIVNSVGQIGFGVFVGVAVGVFVGVFVGVAVLVVVVVGVLVFVGVFVGVGVGRGHTFHNKSSRFHNTLFLFHIHSSTPGVPDGVGVTAGVPVLV